MTTYSIDYVPESDEHLYMGASQGRYFPRTAEIKANSHEEAEKILRSQKDIFRILSNESAEEIEQARKEDAALTAAFRKKEAAQKARRKANAQKHADEMGLSLQDYYDWMNYRSRIRRTMRDIEQLQDELADLKKQVKDRFPACKVECI